MTYRDPESYKPERQHEGRDFENSLFSLVDKVTPEDERTDEFETPDICARKHGGNSASNDANQRIAISKSDLREQIYHFAILNGSYGVTVHEVVSHLKIVIQTASARLSELKRDGLLIPKGDERRGNATVLVPVYAEVK